MQDKDSEALRNQRRRRKRIARMKHTIIAIIAGWIILSMILIIFLLVRTRSMERKLDELWQMQRVMNQQVPDTEALPQEETGGMDTETVAVTAPASGIDETDNLAQDGDVHKVYLTFDDGPSENTDAILDVLSEYDVKATFFELKPAKKDFDLTKRVIDEGHTLAMHGYQHKYNIVYKSKKVYKQNLDKLRNLFFKKYGVWCTLSRFPGGSSNTVSRYNPGIMTRITKDISSWGYHYFDWNVASCDSDTAKNANDVYRNVTTGLIKGRGNVVLMHDFYKNDKMLGALDKIIKYGKKHGYTFLPLTASTTEVHHKVNN